MCIEKSDFRKNIFFNINSSLIYFLIAIVIPFLLSCSDNQIKKKPPNVILISLDTLRKDSVGAFTAAKDSSTPQMDAFRKDAIAYTNAYAPMPFTPPSHMSMLTGVYPDVHTVHGTINDIDKLKGKDHILPSSIPTLAELLKKNGYLAKGFFSTEWLSPGFGFGRGFDYYHKVPGAINLATNMTNKAIEQIEPQKESQKPFFLFLHYYDPHSDFDIQGPPYQAPKPFQIKEYESAGSYFCYDDNLCATGFLLKTMRRKIQLPEKDIDLLKKLYLAGIRYLDSEIGRFIAELKKADLYDNTLIIITSDHGEEFQEHHQLIHSQVYEECSAVPLLVKLPNSEKADTTVDILVTHNDLLPSVLSALKIPLPDQVQGKSILPSDIKKENRDEKTVLMQDKLFRHIYSIRRQNYKIVYNFKTEQAELYNLAKDPKELNNIAGSKPKIAERLIAHLRQILETNNTLKLSLSEKKSDFKGVLLNKEQKKRLRSLGYTN